MLLPKEYLPARLVPSSLSQFFWEATKFLAALLRQGCGHVPKKDRFSAFPFGFFALSPPSQRLTLRAPYWKSPRHFQGARWRPGEVAAPVWLVRCEGFPYRPVTSPPSLPHRVFSGPAGTSPACCAVPGWRLPASAAGRTCSGRRAEKEEGRARGFLPPSLPPAACPRQQL